MGDARRQAEDNFHKARNRELFQGLLALIRNEDDQLLSFRDIKAILKPKSETYLGMRTVLVDRLVGSEGRYRDFNRSFLPRRTHLKTRWTNVDVAHYHQVNLPAIKLYELGGVYFVRDGNHRVSVARSRGIEFIDAEVVCLDSEILLEPGIGEAELSRRVIEFERERFLKATGLGSLRPECELRFTAPGRYDEIVMHVNGHKYFINQDKDYEIPLEEALLSWHDTVYQPIVSIIREEEVLARFPGRTAADLYVWTVRHWDQLKRRYGQSYSMRRAIRDFSTRHGRGFWQRVTTPLRRLFSGRKDR